MTQLCANEKKFSENDNRLIAEAMRRAMASRFNARADASTIEGAIRSAIRRGTKDMHGLMRAAAELTQTRPVVG